MAGITTEQAVKWEIESLKEAIGCELEVNDEFLAKYCSKQVREVLQPLPESDRNMILGDCITYAWVNGSPASNTDDIWLDCGEIELQIESTDDLDDPDEWTINGDLAYYYIGYGISYNVDIDRLKEAAADFFGDDYA